MCGIRNISVPKFPRNCPQFAGSLRLAGGMKGQPVVLCGRCMARPDVPATPKSGDELRCPHCGATDTVSRVLSQARHHATHLAARDLDKRRVQRGERLRSFTPTRMPRKALKWISGCTDR